jgi:hypothetical protein
LLTCAVAAAPLWAVVSLAQAATREGFDLTHHPLSALSNGSLGWLQISNFLVAGRRRHHRDALDLRGRRPVPPQPLNVLARSHIPNKVDPGRLTPAGIRVPYSSSVLLRPHS